MVPPEVDTCPVQLYDSRGGLLDNKAAAIVHGKFNGSIVQFLFPKVSKTKVEMLIEYRVVGLLLDPALLLFP